MLRFITGVVVGVALVMPIGLLGAVGAIVDQQKAALQSNVVPSVVMINDRCSMPGLYGTFQREIGIFIQDFAAISHDVKARHQLPKPNRNKLMLYGPPGNGKTELAQKIAQLTNSKFMHIKASSIVGTFQNSGAVALEKYFDDIEQFLASTRGTIVMFFDEIDALGSTRSDQNNSNIDTERAMQTLWQYLSKYEKTSRIRFIFASNNIKNLPKAFLNRLHDDLVIEIDNPTAQERKGILRNILLMYEVPLLNQEELKRSFDRLVKNGIEKHKGCAKSFAILQSTLMLLDNQLRIIDTRNSDLINDLLQRIDIEMAYVKSLLKLNKQEASDTLKITQSVVEEIDYYCQIVNNHVASVQQFLSTKNSPQPVVIEAVVDKTEGLSIRALFAIASSLHDHMRGDAEIAPEVIKALVKKAHDKLKLEEAEGKRKSREEDTKDLQLQELQERKKQLVIDNQTKELQLQELVVRKKQQDLELKIKEFQLKDLEAKTKLSILERRAACLKLLAEVKAFTHGMYCSNKFGDKIPEMIWTNQKKDMGNLLGKLNFSAEDQNNFKARSIAFLCKTITELDRHFIELEKEEKK